MGVIVILASWEYHIIGVHQNLVQHPSNYISIIELISNGVIGLKYKIPTNAISLGYNTPPPNGYKENIIFNHFYIFFLYFNISFKFSIAHVWIIFRLYVSKKLFGLNYYRKIHVRQYMSGLFIYKITFWPYNPRDLKG